MPKRGDWFEEILTGFICRTITEIVDLYKPDACVVQCGADSIAGDPLGGANLLPEDIGKCVEQILSWKLPTMFLGGG